MYSEGNTYIIVLKSRTCNGLTKASTCPDPDRGWVWTQLVAVADVNMFMGSLPDIASV
jgi:hypothetical protein